MFNVPINGHEKFDRVPGKMFKLFCNGNVLPCFRALGIDPSSLDWRAAPE